MSVHQRFHTTTAAVAAPREMVYAFAAVKRNRLLRAGLIPRYNTSMIRKGDQKLAVVEQRILQASASIDAVESLRSTLQRLAAEGYSKEEIYQRFDYVMLTVRREHNGADSNQEDALLEVMDMLTGFCKPDLILLPDKT